MLPHSTIFSGTVTSCTASGSTPNTPIAYDRLPHYFLEFDIFDKHSGEFLSTGRRASLLGGGPVLSVPVLGTGSVNRFESYFGRSRCSSTELMEGLYLKREHEGRVVARYKYVRPEFLQAVADSDSHWMDRPIVPNTLCDRVDL